MYTPNVGFEIAVFDKEEEQSCLTGITKGVRGRSEGVGGSSKGVVQGLRGREPETEILTFGLSYPDGSLGSFGY